MEKSSVSRQSSSTLTPKISGPYFTERALLYQVDSSTCMGNTSSMVSPFWKVRLNGQIAVNHVAG